MLPKIALFIMSIPTSYKYTTFDKDNYISRQTNIKKLLDVSSAHSNVIHHCRDSTSIVFYHKAPIAKLSSYMANRYISQYDFFTIISSCCNCIMLYHMLFDCYHAKTQIDNFDIYDNSLCFLSTLEKDKNTLTLDKKIDDYEIFFDSCYDNVSEKNYKLLQLYRKSFMNRINLTR